MVRVDQGPYRELVGVRLPVVVAESVLQDVGDDLSQGPASAVRRVPVEHGALVVGVVVHPVPADGELVQEALQAEGGQANALALNAAGRVAVDVAPPVDRVEVVGADLNFIEVRVRTGVVVPGPEQVAVADQAVSVLEAENLQVRQLLPLESARLADPYAPTAGKAGGQQLRSTNFELNGHRVSRYDNYWRNCTGGHCGFWSCAGWSSWNHLDTVPPVISKTSLWPKEKMPGMIRRRFRRRLLI